jgi:hypothetical protein
MKAKQAPTVLTAVLAILAAEQCLHYVFWIDRVEGDTEDVRETIFAENLYEDDEAHDKDAYAYLKASRDEGYDVYYLAVISGPAHLGYICVVEDKAGKILRVYHE